MVRLSNLPTLALLLVLLVTVAFFGFTHEGLYDLDDFLYARYAHALASGQFQAPHPDPQHLLHDPLRERLLIFGPVAGLYRLLGVGIVSTTLWPLLCTLGCAGLVWALYRRQAPVVAAGATLLLGLHYFTLNLSTYLYPDNILMFWCLAGAAVLLTGRRPGQRRPGAWGAGFAALSFAALLSKETIVYYLPFYIGVLSVDVWHRRHGRFWGGALGVGGLLLGAYLLYYQHLTHDALYRYHLIEQTNTYMRDGSYAQAPAALLLARVTWAPLAFFVGTGVGVMLVLAGAAAFGRPAPADVPPASAGASPANDARFWLALAGSTLALYWWGSTSLHAYNPISLHARMSTPLLPPLALAGGFGLRNLWRTGRGAALAGAGLLLMAAWLRGPLAVPYAGLGLLFGAVALGRRWLPARLQPGTSGRAALLLAGLAGVLLMRPLYFMTKPSVSGHFAQARVLRAGLPATARGTVLVDEVLLRNHPFYYGFRVPAGLRFRSYWAADTVRRTPGEPRWLLLNRATLTNPELTRLVIRYAPDSVLRQFPRRRLVLQDGPVSLYEVP